jgi:hypothetical protein
MRNKWFLYGLAAVMAVAVACGGDTETPVSPSATTDVSASAASDGSTLKITAPTLSTPADGSTADGTTPNLVLQNASSKFVPQTIPSYRFVIVDSSNATVYDSGVVGAGASLTGHRVLADKLKQETVYKWRARGENGSTVGPWSNYFTFTTPKALSATEGYQTATTLWDPLMNGKSIGRPNNMEFTVGKGARTIDFYSFIQYPLRQTLTQGEMSFYVDNFNPLAAGGKTKFASMSSDAADVTTDPWRFTLEKRGASYPTPGQVRWRIITGNATSAVNDGGPFQPVLDKTKTHFIRFTWGNGRVTLLIAEADPTTGALGTVRLNSSVGYAGTYRPTPHMAYIGAEAGRGGPEDASVPNMTVRYVWISDGATPRPGMAARDLMVGEGPGY